MSSKVICVPSNQTCVVSPWGRLTHVSNDKRHQRLNTNTVRRTVLFDDVMMPNFIPAIQLQGLEALLQGRLSFQSRRFSDPTYHPRSHRAAWVARLTYAGLQHKNPTSALCGFLMKTKLPALRLSCWKVLTLLTSKVPLKESDNLPQVGRSQTSAAAKLILNSPLTLASLLQDLPCPAFLRNFSFSCGIAA